MKTLLYILSLCITTTLLASCGTKNPSTPVENTGSTQAETPSTPETTTANPPKQKTPEPVEEDPIPPMDTTPVYDGSGNLVPPMSQEEYERIYREVRALRAPIEQ